MPAPLEPLALRPTRPLRQRRGYSIIVLSLAALVWGLLAAALLPGPEQDANSNASPPAAEFPSWSSEEGRLQKATQDATDRRSTALGELDALLAPHFRQLAAAAEAIQAAGAPTTADRPVDEEPSANANRPAAMIVNSKWQAIAEKLRLLEVQKTEESQRLTREHPQLQRLDEQIASVREELATTPELVPAPLSADRPSEQPSRAAADGQAQWATRAAADTAARAAADHLRATTEYQRLWPAVVAADRQATESQRAYEEALVQKARASSPSISSEPDAPHTKVRTVWWTYAAVVVAIALVAGAAGLFAPAPADPDVFISSAEVEATLPLPILGITGPGRNAALVAEQRQGARRGRWFVIASEATIVLFVVLAVMIAARHTGFVDEMFRDPVGGMQRGIQELTGR